VSAIFGFLVAGCCAVAIYAVVTLPSWLLSAMNRSCLWRLRDDVFDARRAGELPDSSEIQRFIEQIETFIVVAPEVSALQLRWLRRRLPEITEKKGRFPADLPHHDLPERERFFRFQYELARILTRQDMTGSWSGLLLVAPRHPTLLWDVLFSRQADAEFYVQHTEARFSKRRQLGKDKRDLDGVIEREERQVNEVEQLAPEVRRRKGKGKDEELALAGGG
jgi:hypothetical protein